MQMNPAQNVVTPGEPIAFDQPCPLCGYNLRSLQIGNRCPECGGLINPDNWLRPMQRAFRNPRFTYRMFDAARLMLITLAVMVVFAFLPMKFLGEEPVRRGVWAKPYGVYVATIWWVLGWYAVCKFCQTCRWEKGTRWWNILCWMTRTFATLNLLLIYSITRIEGVVRHFEIVAIVLIYLIILGTPLIIYLHISHALAFLGWKKRWTFVGWGMGIIMPVLFVLLIMRGAPPVMLTLSHTFSQYTFVLLPTPLHGWPFHVGLLIDVAAADWNYGRWGTLPAGALLLPLFTQICLIITLRRYRSRSNATTPADV